MQCAIEIPFGKQRLLDTKDHILEILAGASDPHSIEWHRTKLENVNKAINNYNRRY